MRKQENVAILTVCSARLDDVMEDIARFHNVHRTFGGKLLRSGRVVVLKVNNKSVRVVARGGSDLRNNEISLSSEMRSRLGISSGKDFEFIISKAGWVDDFLWAWNATNAMPRVGARLGALSLIVSVIGLALGLYSLVLTLCQPTGG